MNRRRPFGRMLAWILLAVCFLPVAAQAEDARDGGAESAAVHSRLTALEATPDGESVRVFLGSDGPMTARPFVLDSPDRLVLDLEGVTSTMRNNRFEVDSPLVQRVRVGQRNEGAVPIARVVFDLSGQPSYTVTQAPGGLLVTVNPISAEAAAGAVPSGGAGVQAPAADVDAAMGHAGSAADPSIADAGSAPPPPAPIAQGSEPPSDGTTAPLGAVPGVSPAPSHARIAPAVVVTTQTNPTGSGYATRTISGQTSVYTGKKISLNLVDADIKQVFRLFHDISGLNFVLDPGVSGNVTIVLDEVPWDQALDIILKNNGLDKVYEDNVIRIATTQKLASEAGGRKALREAKELEVEPVTITRTLSYAKAKEMDGIIKTGVLLSSRGKSFFDERTNTLIVTDVPTRIEPLDRLISALDEKTPQVMIEARIVLTARDFLQDLGIEWGFTLDRNPPNSPITSRDFPHNGDVTYALNLPRAASANQLAFNLFNSSGSFALNVALDALETDGRARTLSAPRIATQNNVKAEIEQGVKIPIANSTATEISVEFVNATLRLTVTPQITAEGTVIMDIIVANDQPSKTIGLVNGTPGIDTQKATTKVMVEDGGTTVIGGIFSVSESSSESGVPWFRKIPVFGWLFKNRNITTQNRELLIFITPKILKSV